MSEARHTPGEWCCWPEDDPAEIGVVTDSGGVMLAVALDNVPPPERAANARLIAKAYLIPEAVEVLRRFIETPSDDFLLSDVRGSARALLSKLEAP